MKNEEPISFSEHQRRAVKARWAKMTPEGRSDHARKMVRAREAKRAVAKAVHATRKMPELLDHPTEM